MLNPNWYKRFHICSAAVLGIFAIAVSACSSADRPGSTPPTPVESSPEPSARDSAGATGSSTSPAAPTVTSAAFPDSIKNALEVGPGTVFSQCDAGLNNQGRNADEPGQIFNPQTGRFVELPVPSIPAGSQLNDVACTVGGDQDNVRLFHVMTLYRPPSGLDPESESVSIVATNPFSPEDSQVKPWPDYIQGAAIKEIYPTYAGFIVGIVSPESNVISYVGFNGETLEITFDTAEISKKKESELKSANENVAFTSEVAAPTYAGIAFSWKSVDSTDSSVTYNLNKAERNYEFIDAGTGEVVGTGSAAPTDSFNRYTTPQPTGDNYLIPSGSMDDVQSGSMDNAGNVFLYFDFQSKTLTQLSGFRRGHGEGSLWGRSIATFERILNKDMGEGFLQVFDLAQNEVLFNKDDISGLNIQQALFAGKYLYLSNGSDNPVIDITNSERVSAGWAVRPIQTVGRDWIAVVESAQGSCSVLTTCASQEVKLVFAPGGDYQGPWY